MKTNTAWPEGVITRYLTVGGATVDITQRPRQIDSGQLLDGIATCLGCGARKVVDRVPEDCWGGPEHALTANTDEARRWAQTHADTCRAMPKPTN
jgi:hypothetical protein